jgi:hypothetical protein
MNSIKSQSSQEESFKRKELSKNKYRDIDKEIKEYFENKYKEIEESNDDNSYIKSLHYIVVRMNGNNSDINRFNNKDLEIAANLINKLNIQSDNKGIILKYRLQEKIKKYNETLDKNDKNYIELNDKNNFIDVLPLILKRYEKVKNENNE